jgi:hypothetical protein
VSLRVGGRDSHSAITTVHTLHLHESTLLVHFVAKVDEAVSIRPTSHSIGNDLS